MASTKRDLCLPSQMAGMQYEMGHSGLHLLKSRYLDMQNISRKDTSTFWAVNETKRSSSLF